MGLGQVAGGVLGFWFVAKVNEKPGESCDGDEEKGGSGLGWHTARELEVWCRDPSSGLGSWGQERPHSSVDISCGEVGKVGFRGRGAAGGGFDDLGGGGDGAAGVDLFAEPA